MEIELKYGIPDADVAEILWQNNLFRDVEEEGSRAEAEYKARYFDTENHDFARNEIAYRVRREGDRLVASLKWKGHSEDGLHVREEINVPVCSTDPDPSVFRESSIGNKVMDFIEGKELVCIMETVVRRRSFRIDTGTGLYEFSIDSGEITAGSKSTPISEIEIEIFSGETEELLEIGSRLQQEYGLVEESESKYCRGLKLIG